uniref:Cytochrome c biogenesis factor C n=1 Tax=Haplomitrium hookeri TaxID=37406 RepID=A0A4Y5WY23_HAPHO|nr:cytochrome c biogenesis factor C [Haplomitrium hookeri]QDE12932.1 cytochrome c biogenesis factor C [Haplomitrium hookeri]
MVQPQNLSFLLIFFVVPRGTAAPILFQWLVSRDVPIGAPFSNGIIIPISTSLLLVSVHIHLRGFMRSLDEAKGIVLVGARPVLLPKIIRKSSPKKIQYISFFPEEKALSIFFFFRPFFYPPLARQSQALGFVGQFLGFVVSDKTKSGALFLSASAQAPRALLFLLHSIITKLVGDFSYLESFCGVLRFSFFCTFFLSFHHRRDRLARRKLSFLVPHEQGRRKLLISSLRRKNLKWSRCFIVRASPGRLMTVGGDFRKAPVNTNISHGGVCIFIMGVTPSNAKKIQITGLRPLGSELHIGKVRGTSRGIDQLHGPTLHSICGNSIIYKPSLKTPFMFEHDGSRPALLQSRPTGGAKLSTNERGFGSRPTGKGNLLGPKGQRPEMALQFPQTSLPPRRKGFTVLEHNSFSHWLTMFPEKRFYFSNRETSTTKVAIHTNLFTDPYALIGTGSFETGRYTTVIKPPFIFRIWIGFIMASLGGLLSLFRKLTPHKLDWNQK